MFLFSSYPSIKFYSFSVFKYSFSVLESLQPLVLLYFYKFTLFALLTSLSSRECFFLVCCCKSLYTPIFSCLIRFLNIKISLWDVCFLFCFRLCVFSLGCDGKMKPEFLQEIIPSKCWLLQTPLYSWIYFKTIRKCCITEIFSVKFCCWLIDEIL